MDTVSVSFLCPYRILSYRNVLTLRKFPGMSSRLCTLFYNCIEFSGNFSEEIALRLDLSCPIRVRYAFAPNHLHECHLMLDSLRTFLEQVSYPNSLDSVLVTLVVLKFFAFRPIDLLFVESDTVPMSICWYLAICSSCGFVSWFRTIC